MKKIRTKKFKIDDKVVYFTNKYPGLTQYNKYTISYILKCKRPTLDYITLKEKGDFENLYHIKDFISISEYRKIKLNKLIGYEH